MKIRIVGIDWELSRLQKLCEDAIREALYDAVCDGDGVATPESLQYYLIKRGLRIAPIEVADVSCLRTANEIAAEYVGPSSHDEKPDATPKSFEQLRDEILAALTHARAQEREAIAKWHDAEEKRIRALMPDSVQRGIWTARELHNAANLHRESAAAIRAGDSLT